MALTTTTELIVTSCWCGISLAVSESLNKAARETGRNIYCPLGHSFIYKGSENEQLRKQVEDLKTRLGHARDEAAQERQYRQSTERSLTATKGVLTRTQRRIAAGVCPCCHRHFVNMQRHMSTKHPDYDALEGRDG